MLETKAERLISFQQNAIQATLDFVKEVHDKLPLHEILKTQTTRLIGFKEEIQLSAEPSVSGRSIDNYVAQFKWANELRVKLEVGSNKVVFYVNDADFICGIEELTALYGDDAKSIVESYEELVYKTNLMVAAGTATNQLTLLEA